MSNSPHIQTKLQSDEDANSLDTEPGYQRANATFVTLARNQDLFALMESIRSVENSFNRKYKYDWVFFNDVNFTPLFMKTISNLVSGQASFHTLEKEYWGYPEWVDQDKARENRNQMVQKGIIYGGSESYRHMCRFESGFFWRHPALSNYKYYWRVEPNVKYSCLASKDYFKYMEEKNLTYGFTISLIEFEQTIPTLWQTTLDFINQNPQYVNENNLADFITDANKTSYNLCHFWSNFEIADLDFYRSEAYTKYFEFLDATGGFFYERWGDAPVHSIAASLFLNKTQIHHFDDIGYEHPPFQSCPSTQKTRIENKCICNPAHSFTWKVNSCARQFYRAHGTKRPVINGFVPHIPLPLTNHRSGFKSAEKIIKELEKAKKEQKQNNVFEQNSEKQPQNENKNEQKDENQNKEGSSNEKQEVKKDDNQNKKESSNENQEIKKDENKEVKKSENENKEEQKEEKKEVNTEKKELKDEDIIDVWRH